MHTDDLIQRANIGVIGLGVMGSHLAQNLARSGQRVAIYDKQPNSITTLAGQHPEASFVPSCSYAELAQSLQRPRKVILMVPAGEPTEKVIEQLTEVFEAGDIIIDGGNSRFSDTIRRSRLVESRNMHLVGAGISGGEEGALHGPSIMVGCDAELWPDLQPLFEGIAAVAEGEPCAARVGGSGAGHYVKMVHNGIEYADMQLIAETYDLLRSMTGMSPAKLAEVFDEWNSGPMESYLLEITAEVLRYEDAHSGQALVDIVLDQAQAKGTGAWTVETALQLGVPVPTIAEAVFSRSLSSSVAQRQASQRALGHRATALNDENERILSSAQEALYAARVVAYAQGFDLIRRGAAHYGWDVDLAHVARIWRGGCIIRAKLLDRISTAYTEDPRLETILSAPSFSETLGTSMEGWREAITAALQAAVPLPAISSSLAYVDAMRRERLPSALIQIQRDFFGSHSYRRVDREGVFHVSWSGDRQEARIGS